MGISRATFYIYLYKTIAINILIVTMKPFLKRKKKQKNLKSVREDFNQQ